MDQCFFRDEQAIYNCQRLTRPPSGDKSVKNRFLFRVFIASLIEKYNFYRDFELEKSSGIY